MALVEKYQGFKGRRAEIAGGLILAASAIAGWGCADGKTKGGSNGLPIYEDDISYATELPPRELKDDTELPDRLTIGRKIPDLNLEDWAGNTVELSQYGGKVIILFSDPTNIPRPRETFETWKNIEDSYPGEIVLISLVVDPIRPSNPKEMPSSIPGTLLLVIDDLKEFHQKFSPNGSPNEFLIDRDGTFLGTNYGVKPDDEFLSKIDAAVNAQ